MTFFDRVRFGVSGTPGTGAITVGAAVSGFTTPAGAQPSAIADGTAVQLLAEDGTAWEIFDSVYTVSGTSCSRGTLRASSTGSQLSLTSAAVISVIAAARQVLDKTIGGTINVPGTGTAAGVIVTGNAATPATVPHPDSIQIVGKDDHFAALYTDSYGTVGGFAARSIMNLRAARGTLASPTQLLAGDEMARWSGRGMDNAGAFTGSLAGMSVIAAEDITTTAQGAYLAWRATAIGTVGGGSTTVPPIFMALRESGGLLVGDQSFCQGTDPGNGVIGAKTSVALYGSTSGTIKHKAPAVAGSNTVTWPAGTTDFSATGASGHVVKQNSAGAALTVGLPQISILAYDNTQTSHTGNTSLTTLKTITIPANSMGANGSIRITIQWGGAGTAGTKTTVLSFGGATYVSIALGATTIARRDSIQISNRNATNSQIGHASTNAGYAGATTAVITSAIDTTANVTVLIQGQLANSADTISVESYLVELIVP